MGVFPAASRAHVPEPWGVLMTDPVSILFIIIIYLIISLIHSIIISQILV